MQSNALQLINTMKKRSKPQLSIECPSEDQEGMEDITSEGKLIRINSTKNHHELRRFNFTLHRPYRMDRFTKQQKINRLEKEKAQLMKSLQILKNGAVSAIIEKEETIDKLRKIFTQQNGAQTDDTRMQELQNLLQYIQDLETERNKLKQDLHFERRRFEEDIYERQKYIQELINELNWSEGRIESLQKYDVLLEEKIRVMEEANENLSFLLNNSQASQQKHRKKSCIDANLEQHFLSPSIDEIGQTKGSGSLFDESSSSIKGMGLNFLLHQSREESVIEQKISHIKRQHQIQMQDLTDFYESRLETLKKACYMEFQGPLKVRFSQETDDNMKTITDIPEDRSSKSYLTKEFKFNLNQVEKTLTKNYSITSYKSKESNIRMSLIDEREEIQYIPTHRSLKRQLLSESQLSKALSSKSDDMKSDDQIEEDKQSQFSYKYFYYPKRGFKKKVVTKAQVEPCQSYSPEQEKKGSKFKWDKIFWFTLGTITGGSILTLGQKILRN